MKIDCGTRSICGHPGCGEGVYYRVTPADDPWVHENWPKHASTPEETGSPIRLDPATSEAIRKLPPYDHKAEPTMQQFTFEVTVQSPLASPIDIRNAVSRALHDSQQFASASVSSSWVTT